MLFIQMELCDITLGRWLLERNEGLPKNGMLESCYIQLGLRVFAFPSVYVCRDV